MNIYQTDNPELFNELERLVESHPRAYFNILKSRRYTCLLEWIDKIVFPMLDGYKISTKCNWIINGITSFPECEMCGKTFGKNIDLQIHSHYSHTCPECSRKLVAQSALETVKSKLEHDSSYYDKIVSKRKATNLRLHGDQNWNNAEQNKSTCMERYSVDNVRKTQHCKMKCKQTKKERHGDENYTNIEKFKKTCLQNYGVEWPMQNAQIRSKSTSKYIYSGQSFDSKQELCFYIWLKDNGINFQYKPDISLVYVHDSKQHHYIPDFIVEGQITEVKGDHFFKDDGTMQNPFDHSQDALYEAKHQCMLANNVKIILQSECGMYIDFVKTHYGEDFIRSTRMQQIISMEFQSWNAEMSTANLLFMQVFKNIRIERPQDDGSTKQILVQCMLGQRSRILKGLENPDKRGNMRLPMIIINRTGYSRNGERLNNLHNEVKYELAPAYRKYELMTPVPVDIDYEVTVISKYPSDIDMIASNFMVFFNSDIYVSCEHPKYQGIKLNNQIVMQDSVSEDHPDEPDAAQDDLTTATFQFIFKTYLFAGTKKAHLVPATTVATQISTVLSDVVVVIPPDKIDEFQEQFPDKAVSASMQQLVTTEITSLVTSDISVEAYDGVPLINTIHFGFYAVPGNHDIPSYIQSVDNGAFGPHVHTDISGYLSSGAYVNTGIPTALSDPYVYDPDYAYHLSTCELSTFSKPLSGLSNVYGVVDRNCSLEPHVDKLYWRIDADSVYAFPNNVTWGRD